MHQAETWPARGWTCEECGSDNFVRVILRQTSPNQTRQVGDDEVTYARFEFIQSEKVSECMNCGAAHELLAPTIEDEE